MSGLARFTGGLLERVIALLFAVAAMQFPVYYTAYGNAVAGALAEAQARYEQLLSEAALLQLSADAFIERHESNSDDVFRASGRIHRTTLEHYRRYSAMNSALTEAVAWRKPLVLAQNWDPRLAQALSYQPGLPLTPEAGLYALVGLLLGWLFGALLTWPLRRRAVPAL